MITRIVRAYHRACSKYWGVIVAEQRRANYRDPHAIARLHHHTSRSW